MKKRLSIFGETLLISLSFASLLFPLGVFVGINSSKTIDCDIIQTKDNKWRVYRG